MISGDHLTMDSDYCEDIDSSYERKVYTTYINAPIQPERTTYREFCTFDAFLQLWQVWEFRLTEIG